MAMTNTEKAKVYRDQMYAAGYKQMRIWVPRESEGKTAKMQRKMFLVQLEALTAGWSEGRLSDFFSGVLKTVKKQIKTNEPK